MTKVMQATSAENQHILNKGVFNIVKSVLHGRANNSIGIQVTS